MVNDVLENSLSCRLSALIVLTSFTHNLNLWSLHAVYSSAHQLVRSFQFRHHKLMFAERKAIQPSGIQIAGRRFPQDLERFLLGTFLELDEDFGSLLPRSSRGLKATIEAFFASATSVTIPKTTAHKWSSSFRRSLSAALVAIRFHARNLQSLRIDSLSYLFSNGPNPELAWAKAVVLANKDTLRVLHAACQDIAACPNLRALSLLMPDTDFGSVLANCRHD